jgi:hypothetical protein
MPAFSKKKNIKCLPGACTIKLFHASINYR